MKEIVWRNNGRELECLLRRHEKWKQLRIIRNERNVVCCVCASQTQTQTESVCCVGVGVSDVRRGNNKIWDCQVLSLEFDTSAGISTIRGSRILHVSPHWVFLIRPCSGKPGGTLSERGHN